jgi:1-deoxy-D-xylulose-5-phosphate synthase
MLQQFFVTHVVLVTVLTLFRSSSATSLKMERSQPRVKYFQSERVASSAPLVVSRKNGKNTRGKERKDRVAILSFGTRLHESLVAANEVEEMDPQLGVTVADARFMKPLDVDLIRQLADDHSVLITIEEGSIGGFGDHVLHFLTLDGLMDDGNIEFRPMVIPDTLFEAATQYQQYEQAGLNSEHIRGTILRLTKRGESASTRRSIEYTFAAQVKPVD